MCAMFAMPGVCAPHVQKCVDEIIRAGKVGICAGNIGIVHPKAGGPIHDRRNLCDRFRLVIPYGGQSITWEVIFNASHPEYPPDFIFDDPLFRPEIDNIESLCNWESTNSPSLLQVIKELLELYRKLEVSQLDEHSRLKFEYSSLIHQAGFTETDVEVLLNRKNKSGPVNFLIRLPVDFSRIPAALIKEQQGEDSAVLLVTFQTPDGNRVIPQLYMSPRLEHTLGGSSTLRIPSFPNGGCLMDYVPSVRQLLLNKVEMIAQGFEKRKEYFSAFLEQYGKSVLEYDVDGLSKMSFLFELNDFFFILHISIPLYFPQEKPYFIFQSIYAWSQGRPVSIVCSEYPYSPRWTGNEMAERARSFLIDYVPVFQRNSLRTKS